MTKIVINKCYGRFGLSKLAMRRYCELKAGPTGVIDIEIDKYGDEYYKINDEEIWDWEMSRTDSILIQVVEEFGEAANGEWAELRIVDIPDDVKWYIERYDGLEHIAEEHNTWC